MAQFRLAQKLTVDMSLQGRPPGVAVGGPTATAGGPHLGPSRAVHRQLLLLLMGPPAVEAAARTPPSQGEACPPVAAVNPRTLLALWAAAAHSLRALPPRRHRRPLARAHRPWQMAQLQPQQQQPLLPPSLLAQSPVQPPREAQLCGWHPHAQWRFSYSVFGTPCEKYPAQIPCMRVKRQLMILLPCRNPHTQATGEFASKLITMCGCTGPGVDVESGVWPTAEVETPIRWCMALPAAPSISWATPARSTTSSPPLTSRCAHLAAHDCTCLHRSHSQLAKASAWHAVCWLDLRASKNSYNVTNAAGNAECWLFAVAGVNEAEASTDVGP